MTSTPNSAPSDRPTYQLVVRSERSQASDVDDRQLRALLKVLLRRFGFQCLSVTEAPPK